MALDLLSNVETVDPSQKLLLSMLNQGGESKSMVSPLTGLLKGYLIGKTLKDIRSTKEETKARKETATADIRQIINDPKLAPEDKARQLAQSRAELGGKYGKDFDTWLGGVIDDFWKVKQDTKTGELTKAQNLSNASALRKEFLSQTKDFKTVSDAYTKMDAAFNRLQQNQSLASKNAVDQAIVIVFNKMLDPGSVVRESEFARTPEGMSMLSRMQGQFEKITKGGVGLTDSEREEIVNTAATLLNAAGQGYNKQLDFYNKMAEGYGVDRKLVTSGYDRFSPVEREPSQGQPTEMTPQNVQTLQDALKGVDLTGLQPGQPYPKQIMGKTYIFKRLREDGIPILEEPQIPAMGK